MQGVQISFRDTMSATEYYNVFASAGESTLFEGIKSIAMYYTDKVLKEYKKELKLNKLSYVFELFDIEDTEIVQLTNKYESQVKETLLQALNNKKLKGSLCSKINYNELLNKYKINSLDDFEYILKTNDGFNDELNEIIHKIIIEELSLRIKQTDYYKEYMKRQQNVMIQRIKNLGMILLKLPKWILNSETGKNLIELAIKIIKEFIMSHRVGKPTLFILFKRR